MEGLGLLRNVVRFLGGRWVMREVVSGWEERCVSQGSTTGFVLIKAVDAAEERFRHVWLIDEWDVPVADEERNDWAGWLGGDSMSMRLASRAVVALPGTRLSVYEIGQRAITCR